jgi:ATP-binding cassette, subfamily B, bacterial MsbA
MSSSVTSSATESQTTPVETKQKAFKIYARLFGYLKPHLRLFFLALLATLVFGATDGFIPYILKRVLDDIFGKKDEAMLGFLVIGILIFAVIRAISGFFQQFLNMIVGLKIVEDLRNNISEHLLKLSPSFYSSQSTGGLIASMTNDTLLVRRALTEAAESIIRDTIRVFSLVIAAFYLDPMLALIAFIGVPLCMIPVIKFGKRVRKLSRHGQNQFGGLTSVLHEIIQGHKVVQSFTGEEFEDARFKSENENFTKTSIKAEKYGALAKPTNELIAALATIAVIFYGGQTVISGVRTQGDFIAFLTAMFLMYEPIKKLGRLNSLIQTGVGAAERIFSIIDIDPEIKDSPDAIELKTDPAKIEYQNVFFSYSNQKDRLALKNINLTINPGETVALVGMTGGGKSSIANLVPRFYDPLNGSIKINNQDIRRYKVKSLRQQIAIVTQHVFLFNDTVEHNIGYGKPGATSEEIIAAAKAANAHAFISKLPQGYQTTIGEQGILLFVGERARLAIARALLKDAPILILDEATASLDSESEKLVQEAIERLMQGRTVLVIAHRLSTIRKANRIATVVNGEIIEIGSHDELIAKRGEYYKLYNLQFREDNQNEKVNIEQAASAKASA